MFAVLFWSLLLLEIHIKLDIKNKNAKRQIKNQKFII